jgi:hypothetical protein
MKKRFSIHSLTSTQSGAIYKNKRDTIVFLYGLDISYAKSVIIYIILVNNIEFNNIKIRAFLIKYCHIIIYTKINYYLH